MDRFINILERENTSESVLVQYAAGCVACHARVAA